MERERKIVRWQTPSSLTHFFVDAINYMKTQWNIKWTVNYSFVLSTIINTHVIWLGEERERWDTMLPVRLIHVLPEWRFSVYMWAHAVWFSWKECLTHSQISFLRLCRSVVVSSLPDEPNSDNPFIVRTQENEIYINLSLAPHRLKRSNSVKRQRRRRQQPAAKGTGCLLLIDLRHWNWNFLSHSPTWVECKWTFMIADDANFH